MSFRGNGEVAISNGALSRDAFAGAPDPLCLSHELPLLTEGVRCPLTGDIVCSVDDFRAGTGRRETEVGGGCHRAVDEVGELITSWPAELEKLLEGLD
jgi:hypothetical protein